jgi:hypothetical protein
MSGDDGAAEFRHGEASEARLSQELRRDQ